MSVQVRANLQASLFDVGAEPSIDPSFTTARRDHLGDGAWVDIVPRWVTGADELFGRVLDALDWREGVERIRGADVPRPRLVASFDHDRAPGDLAVVTRMAAALTDRYGVGLHRVTCNLYRDGRDSVAWHGDRVARDLPTATVAVLTLGATRPFRLRPRDGGASVGYRPAAGDLVVMGGTCQRTWRHAVPKVASAGPRIAVMFRHAYDV